MNNDRNFAGNYLVLFVDILGQQEQLRQIRCLPDKSNPKQVAEFESLLKKTVGTVNGFRDAFYLYFKGAEKQHIDVSRLTEEQKCLFDKSKSNEIKSHMFSDFVTLFLSLRDDINKVPMIGVYSALNSAALSFIAMLSEGYAIRGGMDIGVGVEFWEGEIYGPALARAYALESKIAQYPRIILGDEIVNYIQLQRLREEDNVFSTMNKRFAEVCANLTAIDDDGYVFLDYLGEGFRNDISSINATLVNKAYKFVISESERCKSTKNSKLAFRYSLLRDYFEDRISNWNYSQQLDENAQINPADPAQAPGS